MRTLIALVTVLSAAGSAQANRPVSQLDAGTLPASCRWMSPVPAGAPAHLQLAAMTSAANCTARVRLNAIKVEPTQASVDALRNAAAQSIGILDSVIASNDVAAKIIAEYSKADLLDGIAVRISSSVSGVGTYSGPSAAEFKRRADDAFALGEPFRQRATVAFRDVTRLAPAAGTIESNPVVAYAVEASRTEAGPIVSRR